MKLRMTSAFASLPASLLAGLLAVVLAVTLAGTNPTWAAPEPSIAMHGTPIHVAPFAAFPYVNPAAPKGGRLSVGVLGTYNSLNPLIYKGGSAPGVNEYVYERLMARSADEPFSEYGLLAETIDVPDDRSSATFVIRREAAFSDGVPVTADDVVFSHGLLREHGWPFMRDTYRKVSRVVKLDDRSVRFEFGSGDNREMPLLIGLMPILPKHATDPATFEETTLTPPIGSGPYTIATVDSGRSLAFKRNPNWWGRNLPINRGRFNFDEVHYEFFRASSSLFEAFKSGAIDVMPEDDSARWARGYAFPAVTDGRIVKREFETRLPAGMSALVFNTRRPLFADRRVRRALSMVFDAEWINAALFGALYKRTQSFFERSELSSAGIPEDAEERRLLAPFPDAVTPAIADGTYRLPTTHGNGDNRANERAALALLAQAGYRLVGRQLIDPVTHAAVTFEVMITEQRQSRLLLAYARSLEQIGVGLSIREVDDAQYESRLKSNDFDMVQTFWNASLSPGTELWNRWGSAAADRPATRNYPGIKSAAADAMIKAITEARSAEDFRSAVRALDRVLRSGDYVIPLFHPARTWVAFWTRLQHPDVPPNSGFDLDTWWALPD